MGFTMRNKRVLNLLRYGVDGSRGPTLTLPGESTDGFTYGLSPTVVRSDETSRGQRPYGSTGSPARTAASCAPNGLYPGPGRDVVGGYEGDDSVDSADGQGASIVCGAGTDVARVDLFVAARDCVTTEAVAPLLVAGFG
jgi:hypothetical protein